MKPVSRCASHLPILLLVAAFLLSSVAKLVAEPLPLKRAVELALSHSTTAGVASADEQRAFASYREARNQFMPQFIIGSGLGKSWGFPLSLEGSAPAIVNLNSQSALLNPALRDFIRAAKTEAAAASSRTKDQRNEVIQDTVLSYAELSKWEALRKHLGEEQENALTMEQIVDERIQEGVDKPLARNQAKLITARVRLRMAEAQGAMDVLRNRLSHLTGLPAASIDTAPDFRARGEHRAMWPSVDFAAQYALLSTYNNYDLFFKTFQRHNATLGVAIRFPFLSASQRARAQSADAEALRARKQAEGAKNQVSEETLRLQRSVEQLAAAQQVADLEYQVAQSNLEATQVRVDAGTATVHDAEDARNQADERFNALQDANFQLERARIILLRATGVLETWVGAGR